MKITKLSYKKLKLIDNILKNIIKIKKSKKKKEDLNNILDEKFSKEFVESEFDHVSEKQLTEEDIVKAHDKDKLREIDMTHLVDGKNPWNINTVNETSKEGSRENSINLKLIALQEKQIQLASVILSDKLKERMKEMLEDGTDLEEFKKVLSTQFKELELDSKHKDTLIKMKKQLEMVLVQFAGDKINKRVCDMVKFEVEKLLNNLKNMNGIFDYKVQEASIKDNSIRVEGTWAWEDINERQKAFGIEVGEKIKIEFK